MAEFYVVQDGLLVSHGFAQDGTEAMQAGPGQTVVVGAVPGYAQAALPHRGARWAVEQQAWVDTRTEKEKQVHAEEELAAKRRAMYPPLSELAAALVAREMGDESKMEGYLARCAQVKAECTVPSGVI
jgi:hypothetical protein